MFKEKIKELPNNNVIRNSINMEFSNMTEIERIYSDYRSAIMVICKCKEEKIPIAVSPYKDDIKRMSNPHVVKEHTEEHENLIKELTEELEQIVLAMKSQNVLR